MSYARRTDPTHADIRDGLRRCGWLVLDARGLAEGGPDLIAATPVDRRIVLLEVKALKGKLQPKQQRLLAQGWPIQIVHTLEEALLTR